MERIQQGRRGERSPLLPPTTCNRELTEGEESSDEHQPTVTGEDCERGWQGG